MKVLQGLVLGFVCLLGATTAGAVAVGDMLDSVNHVCVILDTSYSMQGYTDKTTKQWHEPTDEGRLAVLSTVLLHDLLNLDTGQGSANDSFTVMPFQSSYPKWTDQSPPPLPSPKLVRLNTNASTPTQRAQARSDLIEALSDTKMPRTGEWTYYSPYIERALKADCIPDPSAQDPEGTTRTIVLITDGLSDREKQDHRDKEYIIDVLLDRLRQKKTRLYVLYFQSDPSERSAVKQFFQDIYDADQGNSYRVFPTTAFDATSGKELPAAMVKLFSQAFGYEHDPQVDHKLDVGSNPPAHFDLAKTFEPLRAVVVALRLDPSNSKLPAPDQYILNFGGAALNQLPPLEAQEDGGSYSAIWVQQPPTGIEQTVAITDGQLADSVFVLRPTRLKVQLREYAKVGTDTRRSCFDKDRVEQALQQNQPRFETMANKDCWLEFLVRPPGGNATDVPDQLELTFWLKKDLGSKPYPLISKVNGEAIDPQHHRVDPQQQGQRFHEETIFSYPQAAGSELKVQKAVVTVKIVRGDALVGGRGDDDPFRVYVYPRVEVTSFPMNLTIPETKNPLKRKEWGDAAFNLEEQAPWIVDGVHANKTDPADDQHDYVVHAYLTTDDAQGNPQDTPPKELKSATFTLDQYPICFKGADSDCTTTQGPKWAQGIALKRHQLVCRGDACTLAQEFVHRFEVTIGRRDSGDPDNPPKVHINFSFRQPPYDHFEVISPVGVTIYVAAHRFNLLALLPFLLLLLGLLAALMLLRPRYALPNDLGYGLATTNNPHRFQTRKLPSASPWKLMFSRKAERAISDSEGELLGWVRPEDEKLYGLRPAPGVEVLNAQGKMIEPEKNGVTLLLVHQAYRLRRNGADVIFRMEYI